jgi:2,3-bisphosphoglycerate-independent phosphoglycerate mutase
MVIYEGAADVDLVDLENTTPLAVTRGVHATTLLSHGQCGVLGWDRHGIPARPECALAVLLGVPVSEAKGMKRGPVEAAGTEVDPSMWTFAYRGNFVPTDGREVRESRVSGISMDETEWLCETLAGAFGKDEIRFAVGGKGRIVVMFDLIEGEIDGGEFPLVGSPVVSDEEFERRKPSKRVAFMQSCAELLATQPVNEVRVDLGENPANFLWLWGGGPPVHVVRPFGGAPVTSAMVTNSPMARGMARLCGMTYRDLGDVWTDAERPELIAASELGKCISAHDLTVVYVEAPEEGGSFGSAVEKVKALDRLDIHVLGRLRDAVGGIDDDFRLMVAALPEDGISLDETPVMMAGTGFVSGQAGHWDELSCRSGALGTLDAERALARFLGE